MNYIFYAKTILLSLFSFNHGIYVNNQKHTEAVK